MLIEVIDVLDCFALNRFVNVQSRTLKVLRSTVYGPIYKCLRTVYSKYRSVVRYEHLCCILSDYP